MTSKQRHPRPSDSELSPFQAYMLQRMDATDAKVYAIVGGVAAVGLLHFIDPSQHLWWLFYGP